jgi:hypothetical protein
MTIINHIKSRFDGIHKQLMGIYDSGKTLSSNSKGLERETFIKYFLSDVFTPQYRFGNGDVIDINGNQSGQIDIVIELPYIPSYPNIGSSDTRLYLAESVASVIEIKSNLKQQWNQVKKTADKISKLKRSAYGSGMFYENATPTYVPLFVVGYTGGWKKLDTIKTKIKETQVEGILIIDRLTFVSSETLGMTFDDTSLSLYAFIACLHRYTSILDTRLRDTPYEYLKQIVSIRNSQQTS